MTGTPRFWTYISEALNRPATSITVDALRRNVHRFVWGGCLATCPR